MYSVILLDDGVCLTGALGEVYDPIYRASWKRYCSEANQYNRCLYTRLEWFKGCAQVESFKSCACFRRSFTCFKLLTFRFQKCRSLLSPCFATAADCSRKRWLQLTIDVWIVPRNLSNPVFRGWQTFELRVIEALGRFNFNHFQVRHQMDISKVYSISLFLSSDQILAVLTLTSLYV